MSKIKIAMRKFRAILALTALCALPFTILSSGGPAPGQDGAQSSAVNADTAIYRETIDQDVSTQEAFFNDKQEPSHHSKSEMQNVRTQLSIAAVSKNVGKLIDIIQKNSWIIKAQMGKHPLSESQPYYFIEFLTITRLFDFINDDRITILRAVMELGKDDAEFKEQVMGYFQNVSDLDAKELYLETIQVYWPEIENKMVAQNISLSDTNESLVDTDEPLADTYEDFAERLRMENEIMINALDMQCLELGLAILADDFQEAKDIIDKHHDVLLLMRVESSEINQPFIQYVYELLFCYSSINKQKEELWRIILSYGKSNDEFEKELKSYLYEREYSSDEIRNYFIVKHYFPDLFAQDTPLYTKLYPIERRLFETVNSSSSSAYPRETRWSQAANPSNSSAQSAASSEPSASSEIEAFIERVRQYEMAAADSYSSRVQAANSAASSGESFASSEGYAAMMAAAATASAMPTSHATASFALTRATDTSHTKPSTSCAAPSLYQGILKPVNRNITSVPQAISKVSMQKNTLPLLTTASVLPNVLQVSENTMPILTVPSIRQNAQPVSQSSSPLITPVSVVRSAASIPQHVLAVTHPIQVSVATNNQSANQNQTTAQLLPQSRARFFTLKKCLISGIAAGILFIGWKLHSKKRQSAQNSEKVI